MGDPQTQATPHFVQLPSEADTEELCVHIVELTSDIQGRPELELPPLEDSIDTDALTSMLEDTSDSQRVQVSFDYAGTTVFADCEGRIRVCLPSE